jgi:hypothetical protein
MSVSVVLLIWGFGADFLQIKPDKAKSNADMDVIPEAHINGKV